VGNLKTSREMTAFRTALNFLFPPLCFHCSAFVKERKLLCKACLEQFTLLSPGERCRVCFAPLENRKSLCGRCPAQALRLAAAFEYEGPVVSLLTAFKEGRQFALARTFAAFITAQLVALNWPIPDLILPLPLPLGSRFFVGYDSNALLAREVGRFLFRPSLSILKTGFSQELFVLRKKRKIAYQTLLLIADFMTTQMTFRMAAEALKNSFSGPVFGLSVACRSEEPFPAKECR